MLDQGDSVVTKESNFGLSGLKLDMSLLIYFLQAHVIALKGITQQ